MKNTTLAFLAAVGLTAMAANVSAQTNASTPHKVFAHTNSLTATVEKIDYDKREITLKGPDGHSMQFSVSEDVERFSNIKKGDEVKIGYYEAVAIAIGKPGSTLPPTGRQAAMVSSDPGKKPGGKAVTVTDITATVEDIDRDKREVTLRGPRGHTVVVEVDPDVGNLEQIKKGDRLAISHTEALAISVEKP